MLFYSVGWKLWVIYHANSVRGHLLFNSTKDINVNLYGLLKFCFRTSKTKNILCWFWNFYSVSSLKHLSTGSGPDTVWGTQASFIPTESSHVCMFFNYRKNLRKLTERGPRRKSWLNTSKQGSKGETVEAPRTKGRQRLSNFWVT